MELNSGPVESCTQWAKPVEGGSGECAKGCGSVSLQLAVSAVTMVLEWVIICCLNQPAHCFSIGRDHYKLLVQTFSVHSPKNLQLVPRPYFVEADL